MTIFVFENIINLIKINYLKHIIINNIINNIIYVVII